MDEYQVIVVGAGIEGSSVAYNCAKNGLHTLILEQYLMPHTRGSSHGACRITRYAYSKPHYAQMMKEAFPLWSVLEKESETELYRKHGLLVVSEPPFDNYETILKQMKNTGKPYEELSSEERQRRYPAFRHGEDSKSFIDLDAGILKASKALRAFQDVFQRFGGCIRDGEKVTEIKPGATVTVTTSRGTYRTKHLVLTPGPWASKLLEPLGLQPPLETWRLNVTFWREIEPGTYKDFPCVVDVSVRDPHTYGGLPVPDSSEMFKIFYDSGIRPVDPDVRDTIITEPQWDVEKVCDYVAEHFPGLHKRPAIVEACMYTMTPDSELILDRHPLYPNIIIGCGFSGHGFKLAPVVGKVLCELVMGKPPTHDITPCSLKRFKNSCLVDSTPASDTARPIE